MNPRQRRGVLLMIVAAFGAIAVFLTIVSYVNTLNRELGTYRTVLRLTQDVDPYQPITEDMVEPDRGSRQILRRRPLPVRPGQRRRGPQPARQ